MFNGYKDNNFKNSSNLNNKYKKLTTLYNTFLIGPTNEDHEYTIYKYLYYVYILLIKIFYNLKINIVIRPLAPLFHSESEIFFYCRYLMLF